MLSPVSPMAELMEEQSVSSAKSSRKPVSSSMLSSMLSPQKKKKEKSKRSKSPKKEKKEKTDIDDPFLPKRMGKSKSMGNKLDILSSKNASFSTEMGNKKISLRRNGSTVKMSSASSNASFSCTDMTGLYNIRTGSKKKSLADMVSLASSVNSNASLKKKSSSKKSLTDLVSLASSVSRDSSSSSLKKKSSSKKSLTDLVSLSSKDSSGSLRKKISSKKNLASLSAEFSLKSSSSSSSSKSSSKRRKDEPDPNDPFLPKRIGKSVSMNEQIDTVSGLKKKTASFSADGTYKKISLLKNSSFSGEFKKVSRHDSGSASIRSMSERSKQRLAASAAGMSPDNSTRSRKKISRNDSGTGSIQAMSERSKQRLAERNAAFSPDYRKNPPKSKAKKAEETKKAFDALVNSLRDSARSEITGDTLGSSFLSSTSFNLSVRLNSTTEEIENAIGRKVQFQDEVQIQILNNTKLDPDAIWYSEQEIQEYRQREEQPIHDQTDVDVEGMFTQQERNERNARMMQAFEAVFDMQMVFKKEKELEDAVGIFRGAGMHFDALTNDHEKELSEEYMNVSIPALEAAALRAANLELNVQFLWEQPEEEEKTIADSAPKIPKRKASNRKQDRAIAAAAVERIMADAAMTNRTISARTQ